MKYAVAATLSGCVLVLLMIALAPKFAPAARAWGEEAFHSEHHGSCPQSAVPKAFRGQGIKCVVGSPNYFKRDESTLGRSLKFDRRDSQLFAWNRSRDGHIMRAVGTGCHGHKVYAYDRDSSFLSGGVNVARDCNMNWHITQRMINGRWKNNEFGSLHLILLGW